MCTAPLLCVLLHYYVYCSTIMCTAPLLCVLLHYYVYCSTIMCTAPLLCVLLHYYVYCSTIMCTAPLLCIIICSCVLFKRIAVLVFKLISLLSLFLVYKTFLNPVYVGVRHFIQCPVESGKPEVISR